jgi:hypothetical protein
MRTCFKKRLVFWGFCGAQVRIISEGFQELSQAIFWFEACGSGQEFNPGGQRRRALREYRQELSRLQAGKQRALAAGEQEQVARLEEDIQAIESELRGGGPADTGARAYDSVRKAFGVLMEHLRREGPEERAFAEHLSSHLSIGLECLYTQPEGRIWA